MKSLKKETGSIERVIISLALLIVASSSMVFCQPAEQPVPVIFETDMGNDVDDALALAMLYRYKKQGLIDLKLISVNKKSLASVQYIDVLNHHYGYPFIPIAMAPLGKDGEPEQKNFANKVFSLHKDGVVAFRSAIERHDQIESSVTAYRRILANSADSTVVVISVGFATNLAALLKSDPDTLSPLSGHDLVLRKVRFLSIMAGNFATPPVTEFNVVTDVPASRIVFEQWPTRVYISPFEVGSSLRFPASHVERNFGDDKLNPVAEAYKVYIPMPYHRQTWDLTSVLFAVEPGNNYFRLGNAGKLSVDDNGITRFSPTPRGKQYCLLQPENTDERNRIIGRYIELTEVR